MLGAAGFETVHWLDIGPPTATDRHIMQWAATNGRVVVTQDLDFGAILAATQADRPSVVQVRGDDLIDARMAGRVAAALKQVSRDIEAGALVTVDTFRTRIRVMPINR